MGLKKPFMFEEAGVLQGVFGDTKREVLEKLGTCLSLAGLLPFGGNTKSIRIIDENTLEAYSEARKVRIKFQELIIFDEEGIQGLPKVKKRVKKKYKVYDWLFAKQGKKHEHRMLTSDDDFVKEVIFHSSFKPFAQKEWYDPVAISYMTRETATRRELWREPGTLEGHSNDERGGNTGRSQWLRHQRSPIGAYIMLSSSNTTTERSKQSDETFIRTPKQ